MALPTTGLTFHVDASNADDLFKTFVSGGPHTGVPVDGDSVVVWDSEEGVNLILKQSGAIAVPVWRATTPLMSLPCLDFTGGQRLVLTNNANGSRFLSDLITNTACTLFIAFYAESITTSINDYTSHVLIEDMGGYWGALLSLASGVPKVLAYNYDGTQDFVRLTVTTGATHVLMLRHEAGNLYASLDGGAESSVPSGNTQNLAFGVGVGFGYPSSVAYDGRIGEIAVYNTALSGTNLTDAISYFMNKWMAVTPTIAGVMIGTGIQMFVPTVAAVTISAVSLQSIASTSQVFTPSQKDPLSASIFLALDDTSVLAEVFIEASGLELDQTLDDTTIAGVFYREIQFTTIRPLDRVTVAAQLTLGTAPPLPAISRIHNLTGKVHDNGGAILCFTGWPNRTVKWSILEGLGTLTPFTTYTDTLGRASARFDAAGVTGRVVVAVAYVP